MDYDLITGNLPGVVHQLKRMKDAEIKLPYKRLPQLQRVFNDCEDAQLVQSFQVNIYLADMTKFCKKNL